MEEQLQQLLRVDRRADRSGGVQVLEERELRVIDALAVGQSISETAGLLGRYQVVLSVVHDQNAGLQIADAGAGRHGLQRGESRGGLGPS